MAFMLGNHAIDEVLYGVAHSFDGDLLYTMDQLSSAEISITAKSSEITDKKGNVVRTVYRSKAGEFSATNAFLHPQIMNAASGSSIEVASNSNKIVMPKINIIPASENASKLSKADLSDAIEGTIKIMGLFGNGANDVPMTEDQMDGVIDSNKIFTAPVGGTDKPVEYMITYQREASGGIKLSNDANKFPDTVKLTLLCSYVNPCSDVLKPCYVVLPSFMASPETTISLDAENQEIDFNGTLNVDYCSAVKALYYIYYPDDEKVISGVVA